MKRFERRFTDGPIDWEQGTNDVPGVEGKKNHNFNPRQLSSGTVEQITP
jgi:hypothetical protein